MKLLCIEACTSSLSVAIFDNGELLAESMHERPDRPHSAILLNSVEHLVSAAGWRKAEISAVCATRGPGSFTSVRVCLASAWGIAKGLSIPLWGIDTLSVLAKGVIDDLEDSSVLILPMIDARRSEVYFALAQAKADKGLDLLVNPSVGSAETAVKTAIQTAERLGRQQIVAVGTGAAINQDLLIKHGVRRPENRFLDTPRAAAIGRLVLTLSEAERQTLTASPLYLRKSEAERKAEANHQ